MSLGSASADACIAYIGNFAVPYSTESHVALSLAANGVKVVRWQEQDVRWRDAAKAAKSIGADAVLWTHTHGFAAEDKHEAQDAMIDGLRDLGIPSVSYHLDRWWGLEREHQVAEPFFATDLVCTADGGHQAQWDQIGVNHVWFPPAVVHTEVGRGNTRRDYSKAVGFVGSWMRYGHRDVWPWRFDMVARLHKRYGSKFRAWPRGNRPVRGQDLNDLYASVRVVVGDSCLAGSIENYWSDRVPETLGRGGFLLHPDVPGLRDEYACTLPWTFKAGDLDALIEVVDHALAVGDEERDRLIDEAVEHVRDHHTYKVRMARLLPMIEAL